MPRQGRRAVVWLEWVCVSFLILRLAASRRVPGARGRRGSQASRTAGRSVRGWIERAVWQEGDRGELGWSCGCGCRVQGAWRGPQLVWQPSVVGLHCMGPAFISFFWGVGVGGLALVETAGWRMHASCDRGRRMHAQPPPPFHQAVQLVPVWRIACAAAHRMPAAAQGRRQGTVPSDDSSGACFRVPIQLRPCRLMLKDEPYMIPSSRRHSHTCVPSAQ